MKIVFGVFLVLLQELTEVHQILDLDQFSPKHQNFGLIPNVSQAPRKWTVFSCTWPCLSLQWSPSFTDLSKLFTVTLQCSWKHGGRWYVKGLEGPRMRLVNREHSCSIISTHYVFTESMNDAWIKVRCSLWEVCYSNFNRRFWVPNSLLSSLMSLSLKRFLPWKFDGSLVQSWGHLPRSDFGTRVVVLGRGPTGSTEELSSGSCLLPTASGTRPEARGCIHFSEGFCGRAWLSVSALSQGHLDASRSLRRSGLKCPQERGKGLARRSGASLSSPPP